jgi:hypothetical protein
MNVQLKICTQCDSSLPITEFYKKGDRIDSACRNCVKIKKQMRYVHKEMEFSAENMMRLFDVVHDYELKIIKKQILFLDKVIENGNVQ